MDSDERLEKELQRLISRFYEEDYGFVTRAKASESLDRSREVGVIFIGHIICA